MNIQTVTKATKTVARRTKHPKTITRISAILIYALGEAASWAYDLGEISTYIPPEWKPLFTKIGFFAGITLALMGEVMPNRPSPPPSEPPAP